MVARLRQEDLPSGHSFGSIGGRLMLRNSPLSVDTQQGCCLVLGTQDGSWLAVVGERAWTKQF